MTRVVVFSMVTGGRHGVTLESFKSLQKKTHRHFIHVVLDQNSDERTKIVLKVYAEKYTNVILLRSEENLGISRGTNYVLDNIAKNLRPDVIVKFDNDCVILDDGCLDLCIAEVVQEDQLVLSPYVEGLVQNKGGAPRVAHDVGRGIGFTEHIGGIVTVASWRAWVDFMKLGGHAVPAPLHGNQDSEFSSKLRSVGYVFGYKEDVRVLHADRAEDSEYPEYHVLRKKEKEVYR